ncbi:hypothetical protein BKA69DRAFT_1054857 [Paraphysoderma sedebokerense]|nr:hypothetical protein BKA69DRAFT_1058521 [Paraphysoderma sedebokerense]KAI9144404.1 hypothetical protein BKA69DRAFT_1054857 [Paraphysoderma sedebokerense]
MLSTKIPLSPSSPTSPAIPRPKMNSKFNSRQFIPSLSIVPHSPAHLSIHSTLKHPSASPLPCPDLLASSPRPFKFHGRHQVLDIFRSEMESSMFKQVSMVHNTYVFFLLIHYPISLGCISSVRIAPSRRSPIGIIFHPMEFCFFSLKKKSRVRMTKGVCVTKNVLILQIFLQLLP